MLYIYGHDTLHLLMTVHPLQDMLSREKILGNMISEDTVSKEEILEDETSEDEITKDFMTFFSLKGQVAHRSSTLFPVPILSPGREYIIRLSGGLNSQAADIAALRALLRMGLAQRT